MREEPRATKSRRGVSKRRRRSTSVAEPTPKKVRRDLTAEVSQSEDVLAGVEEQRGGAMSDEDVPLVHAPRSHSGTVEEGELVDKPTASEEDESIKVDIMSGGDVGIPRISAQLEPSSAHEGRGEAQQPESSCVFISSL